jgi:hypothetical protein
MGFKNYHTESNQHSISKLPKDGWNTMSIDELVKHFIEVAGTYGKQEVQNAIVKTERGNVTTNPEVSKKAKNVMDKLENSKDWNDITILTEVE